MSLCDFKFIPINYITIMKKPKELIDLASIGPAFVREFKKLGITEIEHLKDKDAVDLYNKLQKINGGYLDKCVEDGFRCAIEQANDPNLSDEKKQWFYWSKVRKGQIG